MNELFNLLKESHFRHWKQHTWEHSRLSLMLVSQSLIISFTEPKLGLIGVPMVIWSVWECLVKRRELNR